MTLRPMASSTARRSASARSSLPLVSGYVSWAISVPNVRVSTENQDKTVLSGAPTVDVVRFLRHVKYFLVQAGGEAAGPVGQGRCII